jgi:hypothetical protein
MTNEEKVQHRIKISDEDYAGFLDEIQRTGVEIL